jgi:tRNA A-37 threonylcarbamoyl transferase component Bud32
LTQEPKGVTDKLRQQILDFCRHVAGSARIAAVSLFDNYSLGMSNTKTTLEIVLVIHDFQPRLMSYLKILDGRAVIVFAVDQWIFERDSERGFLGEAFAGTLVFPYTALFGQEFLHEQEVVLKKRLILESLENLVLSFPELSYRIYIKPEYFMYEVIMNRIRVFPPLAYSLSNFNGASFKKNVEPVLQGYQEALKQLEADKKVIFSDGYVMIPKKFVDESQNPRVRFVNLSKNAPRTLFTSFFRVFPQLMNFFTQNSETFLNLQRFMMKKDAYPSRHFVDPQKYVFVPTAKGLVSLADRLSIEVFARKVLLNGEEGEIKFEPVGGVLNDVYLIKAYPNGVEQKVLVKRFKDWSGFKWFPLSLWSFGARTFAVLGRYRLARECAISEFLRCEGFNVPKILHVSHNERLIFMEFVEGEDLSNAIKRIAASNGTSETRKELSDIMKVGEIFARVHSLSIALGDTKPENAIVAPNGEIYLLDFEQASHNGDKAWDVAEFLYFSGHYLQPLSSADKAEAIADSFITGYLNGGGDVNVIKHAGSSKYTRVFSIFTVPSVILAMSNACRKAEAPR